MNADTDQPTLAVTQADIDRWISEASEPLGFFASVIKSGESWSPSCEDSRDKARKAIGQLGVMAHMARTPAPAGDVLARHVAEVMEEDGGCWTACSGCQESDEGYVSEKYYPYSPIFKCQPGGGCQECGGIGVIWQDGAFLASYGDALSDTTPDSAVSGSAEGLREAVLAGFDVATKLLDDSIALGDPRWPEVRTFAADKYAALTEGQQS
ncbi:hypothetical protein [Sphingomonas sp.]|uniref:hypothetical protein n=1 Tax=Sphingomonas sp. TaxID=28214 RepID=UPI0025F00D59|nr:hypothetical protein [Sphingomonas sp.]